VRRRDFVTLIGGAAVTWPLAARPDEAHVLRINLISTQISKEGAKQRCDAHQSCRPKIPPIHPMQDFR
jgi:hypothetical protein